MTTGDGAAGVRIVAWNCNGAAHTKLDALLALRPDVVVLSECGAPGVPAAAPLYNAATSRCWTGTIPTKGLAVLGFGGYTVEEVAPGESIGHHAVAVRVKGPASFNLLGLWTQGQGPRAYVESAEAVLRDYDEILRGGPCVVAGDFNSNCSFDKLTSGGHSRLVKQLDGLGLVSAYHARHGEQAGAETVPTFFLARHRDKSFHLDYVFIPKSWVATAAVEVGRPDPWLRLSDHMPVIVSATLAL